MGTPVTDPAASLGPPRLELQSCCPRHCFFQAAAVAMEDPDTAAAADPADPAPAAPSADTAAASSSSAAPRAQSVQDESRPLMDSARPAAEANEAASAGSAAPLINPSASGQPGASKSTCCVVCVVLLVALGIVTAASAGYETSPGFKAEAGSLRFDWGLRGLEI
eukprot:s6089_g1.t1